MRDGIGSGVDVDGKGRGRRGGGECGGGGVLRLSREELRRMEGRRWGHLPGGAWGRGGSDGSRRTRDRTSRATGQSWIVAPKQCLLFSLFS